MRIAGVNVGEVTRIEPTGDAAKVTFTVDDDGLPLHADAEVTIRPRLFLEGNFFLDLQPGQPERARARRRRHDPGHPDRDRRPARRGADDAAAARPPATSRLLEGYGIGLADAPTAAEDVGQDPDVQGKSGAEAINESFDYGGDAGKCGSQVSEACSGEQPGDLAA